MTEQEKINPYEATEISGEDFTVASEEIDYPGGLRAVAVASVGVALLACALRAIGASWEGAGPILYFGSFAALGLSLPGSVGRRVLRGFFSLIISVPALILYVPVCGFVLVASESTVNNQSFGWTVATVAAMTTTLTLFALLVRRSARVTNRFLPLSTRSRLGARPQPSTDSVEGDVTNTMDRNE